MQINNVNSNISFGKTPVMICEVKKKKETDRRTATLYKMDIKKHEDLNEIKYSKTARTLYPDAEKDRHYMSPGREYYLLKDDSTNEVISCASITTHIRQGEGKTSGFSFVIDGFSENYKYINSAEPILAFLADKAIKSYRRNIIIGTSDCDESSLKREKFSKGKNGEWYMPEQRFTTLIDQAEKRYNMII